MATYDMTSSSTTGVSSNSIAALPSQSGMGAMRMIQAYLDIDALVAEGYSGANGDIFQLLEIPAGTLVLFAGAEVEKAFTSSCTLDMDLQQVMTSLMVLTLPHPGSVPKVQTDSQMTLLQVQLQHSLNLYLVQIRLTV